VKQKITITIEEKLLRNVDTLVDNIFIRNRSQAIEFLIERKSDFEKTAVIMATGSSKYLELSKGVYRPTASIDKTTVIELALKSLRASGFRNIFIIGERPVLTAIFNIIGEGKEYGANVHYVEDYDPPGSAVSLRLLQDIKRNFLVVFGDILFDKLDIEKLWHSHLKNKGVATLMATTASHISGGNKQPIKKSQIDIEGNKILRVAPKDNSQNKLNQDSLVLSSIFVAEPELLSVVGKSLENDVFPKLAQNGLLYCYISNEGETHIHSIEDTKHLIIK